MTIAKHVILSGAKNLPSSGLDVRRKPSPTRMRGGMVSLAPPQHNGFGDRLRDTKPTSVSTRCLTHEIS